jgi:serine/threonine-protein kinase PknK
MSGILPVYLPKEESIQLALGGAQLRLLAPVGEGASSQVWRGLLQESDNATAAQQVAIKVGRTNADVALLAAEAERLLWSSSFGSAHLLAAGKVRFSSHPRIVPERAACLVLSWAGSAPLSALDLRPTESRTQRALQLASDIGDALADLHQAGFAHGDVKPANIVASDDSGPSDHCRYMLVDLGLGDVAERVIPRGATPHYLAPESLQPAAKGDGRTRDVWALGVVLAETALGIQATQSNTLAASCDSLSEPLRSIIQTCLSTNPGSRSAARWVAATAASALHQSLPATERNSRRLCQLRRAYLSARKQTVLQAARCPKVRVQVTGAALTWLTQTIAQLRGWLELRGELPDTDSIPVIGDSSPLERRRILTNVVGPSAASWPMTGAETEDVWLGHWVLACETADPTAWTLSQDTPCANVPEGCPDSVMEVAYALGNGRARSELLDTAERLASRQVVPTWFRIALAGHLRSSGQWGRALCVLSRCTDALARAEAAETARRADDRSLARELLAGLQTEPLIAVRARASATLARIELDEGNLPAARAALTGAPLSTAVCESRALLELASNDRPAARQIIELGRSLPASDEECARLEGLLGMIEYTEGNAVGSSLSFRRAVELATRAGAVLEEATYLTGLSHACVNSGALGEAIAASERAIMLFESLNRPTQAARAALNWVVSLAETGRSVETRSAFDFALVLARQSQDVRCLGYLHLALADALGLDHPESLELLQRAAHWLNPLGTEEELWVAARLCERRVAVTIERFDSQVRRPEISVESRLLWWGARARRALLEHEQRDATMILGELSALAPVRAPLFTQARALAAGIELATSLGASDVARRLTFVVSDLARQAFKNCPRELHPTLEALPWVTRASMPREQLLSQEQIADIESLVRSLGRRDALRDLLAQVVDVLVLWTGVERGLLLLRAPGGKLQPRIGRNLKRADLHGEQLQLSHSLAEQALAVGEPIVAVDATHEMESVHASVHALKLRSVLAVPLISQGQALGVVYLDDRVRKGAFGERELAWVRLVATVAATAIADARDRLTLRRAVRRAERAERQVGNALAQREAELGQVRVDLANSRETRATRFRYDNIIGESLAMRQLLAVVDRVVQSDVPVLISGESGTGKELIADAIHRNSQRARSSFVAENCGAIPEPLLESALFGHIKGAFTGAVRARAGLFDVADSGTLLLDEIGEMSPGMQTKLLRVLENGEIRPVGGDRSHHVNVRVLGATHRNLEEMVQNGTFRQDLYYRLNVVTLAIPPLRERTGDIPILARHFLRRYSEGRTIILSAQAMALLAAYNWPGNIRQLENEIRRAIVLSEGQLLPEHLSADIREKAKGIMVTQGGLNLRERVSTLELDLVREAMEKTEGNLTRAADLLGLSRFGLQKMLKRLEAQMIQVYEPRSRGRHSERPSTPGV